jgi:MerR family Zn(II)-responsive transcriptional regulator of zntA
MRIGKLAERTGLTIDTIRFYEKRGLLDSTHMERSDNGYRECSKAADEQLEMIKHAQAAGFTLTEIGDLFRLWEQNELSNDLIVARLREKHDHIASKITELEQIQRYIQNKIELYERELLGVERPEMAYPTK